MMKNILQTYLFQNNILPYQCTLLNASLLITLIKHYSENLIKINLITVSDYRLIDICIYKHTTF